MFNQKKAYIITLSFLLSACSQHIQKPQKHEEVKKIDSIQKEVQKLNAVDKKEIYRSIKAEIQLHKQKGDEAALQEHNYDAIKAYELVNFYEGYNAISPKKIAQLKKSAIIKSKYHYKEALKYLDKDKKKALKELNFVMMNDPDYKDTRKLLKKIKSDREIMKFLNALRIDLEIKVSNSHGWLEELQAIKKSLNKLAQYEYNSQTIEKANETLKKYNTILVQDAIEKYNKSKLKEAKKEFETILSIYPHNKDAIKYLKKIHLKQGKAENLYLARKSLKENRYLDAIKYAQKVLRLNPNSREAKKIIRKAKAKAKVAVNKYILEGKKFYNLRYLDRAKVFFEKALEIDKTNNTALIYHKKIERQLQTIKSLQ